MLIEMSLDACLNTLRKIAYGGIHDHVGKVKLVSLFCYYNARIE